jgi:CubicO group peptidase (beta-lactamase class C family)
MRNTLLIGSIWLVALASGAPSSSVFPSDTWTQEPDRFPAAKRQAVQDYIASIDTSALMIVQDGVVIEDWGETTRKFKCHSMRKSMLSALYGIQVAEGRIDLSKTLAELGIDDNDPSLTPAEKNATVQDLLKARSGIYHPAIAETPEMKAARPTRGSHAPGTFWYYNNWDFNALGTIFEKETGAGIFEQFRKLIATPLQIQDFENEDGEYTRGSTSTHPAYAFRMTARDLARFGYLFLEKGRWRDRQIVPEDWVTRSTTSYSDASHQFLPGDGYGYMWWVRPKYFFAWGVGGHYVAVAPSQRMVVVHRVNTDEPNKNVTGEQFAHLMDLILQ